MLNNNKLTKAVSIVVDYASQGLWDKISDYLMVNKDVVQLEDDNFGTVLFVLAEFPGSKEILQMLIEYGADLNYQLNGDSPLTNTITGGSTIGLTTLPELELLLESGAKVNNIGPSGNPPLHWAIINCRLKHAELLLKYGADPYMLTVDPWPENAFDISYQAKYVNAIKLLKKFKYKEKFSLYKGAWKPIDE